MGVLDLVAKDKEEYVATAVRIGTDRVAREQLQRRLKDSLGKLFGRQKEAVGAWVRVLEDMAEGRQEKEEAVYFAHSDVKTGKGEL